MWVVYVASYFVWILSFPVLEGEDSKVKVDLQDTRLYCAEGVAEAEACGDTEMQAEFLMQAVLLNTLEGLHVEDTFKVMQVSAQGQGTCSRSQTPIMGEERF